MKRMRMKHVGWIGFAAALLAVGTVPGAAAKADREVIKERVAMSSEERLDAHLTFGAGRLELAKVTGDDIVKVTLEYPEDGKAPEFSYRTHGRSGDLRIEAGDMDWEHDKDSGCTIDMDDDGWNGWWKDGERNDWSVGLTGKIPISLKIESGASNNEIDLTGLKISDLDIEAGACELEITVDEPSGHRTRIISIDGGAAKMRAENLGNLNFDRMEFNGGAGQFTLDFSGELDHRATVEINLGVGQMTIFVPRNVGVKLDCSSCTLASVSVSGAFEEEDDVYVNDKYGQTDGELLFEITASLATVNVETVR